MRTFAFVGHPVTVAHLYALAGPWVGGFLRRIPIFSIKKFMLGMKPYKYCEFEVHSITNTRAKGFLINLPLLPEQFVATEERIVLEKIIQAARLAEKLGAEIVGLGGFSSIIGDEGNVVARNVNIKVTSGNTFPVYLALEAIKKACGIMQMEMNHSTVAVLGATGDIGSICTTLLAKKVRKIFLIARNVSRTRDFAQKLRTVSKAMVVIPENFDKAIAEADIVLTATSAVSSVLEPNVLKPGAIVCDIGVPANVSREIVLLRNDVLVFEGGLAKMPNYDSVNSGLFKRALLESNCIFGCLGETMLLALDDRIESFSLGRGNISEEKVITIGNMAKHHGFEPSDFLCGYKVFKDDDLIRIKQYRDGMNERSV